MNTFNNSENVQFIETILMPGLIGAQDKDIYLVIYDLSGRILFITNKFANLFGFGNWRMLVGKKFSEFVVLTGNNELFWKHLDNVRHRVIKERKLLKYLNVYNYAYGLDAHIVFHSPIFDLQGKVIATQAINRRLGNYDSLNRYSQLHDNEDNDDTQNHLLHYFNLTEEEYEIIFLVHIGATQEEIAEIMNISRSRVAKLISYKICVKLKIEDKSIKSLIKYINKHKLVNVIPKHLIDPQVIMIDSIDYDLPIFR